MDVLTSMLNPIAIPGISKYYLQNYDFDDHQIVARSSFGDMLHDSERNQLYEKALQVAIKEIENRGQKAIVLDIGTGSGLLSMMAVKNGASEVIACEAVDPIGRCAREIIKDNGYDKHIRVINKRSTDLTIGEDGDLKQKCNILVTEIFDTELIGEGALSIFKHAHEFLLEENCIVVPHSATVYAQVVECSIVHNWNKLNEVCDERGNVLIDIPEEIVNCPGLPAVHDIQLSQLPLDSIKMLSCPKPIFYFDWNDPASIDYEGASKVELEFEQDGKAHAVFVWWDLKMDIEGKLILSCAPHWAHPFKPNDLSKLPWRDHWMQAVYVVPEQKTVSKGEKMFLYSNHDEYSYWFRIEESGDLDTEEEILPHCRCGLHVALTRARIGAINSLSQTQYSILKETINENTTVLGIGDLSLMAIIASKLGAKKVFCVDTNFMTRRVLKQLIRQNNLTNIYVLEDIEVLKTCDFERIDVVLSEPYFVSSILPWDNLRCMWMLNSVKSLLSPDVKCFSRRVLIKAIAVQFTDLHKIRNPIGLCEGFDLRHFDKLIEYARSMCDEFVEPQPLWEYPGKALSEVVDIVELDLLDDTNQTHEREGTFKIDSDETCNGVALWMELASDSTQKLWSSGPITPPKVGEFIKWNMYFNQGVCLFPSKVALELKYTFVCNISKGFVSFRIPS